MMDTWRSTRAFTRWPLEAARGWPYSRLWLGYSRPGRTSASERSRRGGEPPEPRRARVHPTSMTSDPDTIDRARIAATERRIRPHVRTTPVMEVAASDFGLERSVRLILKLELLQHAGSFKARGAFAHLTGRVVPPAGVVAASGGNHGVAVAFAANR